MGTYTIRRQANEFGETIYTLSGVNYRNGRGLESAGWEWERGGMGDLGFWFTRDRSVASEAADDLGITIIT